MNAWTLLRTTNFTELFCCLALLTLLVMRGAVRQHKFLTALIALHAVSESISIPLLFFRHELRIRAAIAYPVYFYSSWITFALRSFLFIAVVYGVYSSALEPFKPLRELGNVMFRWVAGVSVVLAFAIAIVPHVASQGYLMAVVGQLQQAGDILTLCLLVFVCFALKPLGIHVRSRLFGTCLGLGIMACAGTIQGAFISSTSSIYSPIYAVTGIGTSLCFIVWTGYFFLPEPRRRMVMLPTTSPYFLWNKISEALNDPSGYVAISGVTPDAFAPGELAGMIASSRRPPAAAAAAEAENTRLMPIAVNR